VTEQAVNRHFGKYFGRGNVIPIQIVVAPLLNLLKQMENIVAIAGKKYDRGGTFFWL
jgi:hypothetical protein